MNDVVLLRHPRVSPRPHDALATFDGQRWWKEASDADSDHLTVVIIMNENATETPLLRAGLKRKIRYNVQNDLFQE